MDQRSASEEKEHQGGYAYHYSYESGSSDDGDSKRAKQSPKQSLKSGNKAESVPSEVAAPAGAGAVAAPAAAGAVAALNVASVAAPSAGPATGYEYTYEYEGDAPAEDHDYYYGYEDDAPRAAPRPIDGKEGDYYYGDYENIYVDEPPPAPAATEGATARSDARSAVPSNSQYSYETYTPAYSSAPVTDRRGAPAAGASVGIGAAAAAAAAAGIRATAAAAGRAVAAITLGRDTLLSSPRSADASSLDASSLDASSLGPSSLGLSTMDASSFAHSVPSSIQRTSMDHLPASASAGGAPLRVASALSAGAAASLGAANIPAASQPAASRRRNPSVAAAWAAGFASRPVPPTDAMDLMQQQRAAALRAEAAGAEAGIATSVPAYSATSVALLAPGALANADALAVLSPAVARSAAEYHKSAATAHAVLAAKQETLRRMQYTVAAMMTQLGQPADEWDAAQKAPSAAEVEQAPKQMQSALRKLLDVAAQNQRQPKAAR